MISIITVVFNDLKGLKRTYDSVMEQKQYYSNFEYIIIDGDSTDGTKEFIEDISVNINYFISEKDSGIYDAMNKGIKASNGDSILFLNAGDYFVGNVLGSFKYAPVFIQVYYTNIFGKYKKIKIKKKSFSIPNCHQGIIFENIGNYYDTKYKICSDYKFYLNLYKKRKIDTLKTEGYIHFDSTGISSKQIKKREYEMYLIRKEYFGIYIALLLLLLSSLKRFLRFILQK